MVSHKQREEEGVGKGEEAYEGEKSEGEREADGEKKRKEERPTWRGFPCILLHVRGVWRVWGRSLVTESRFSGLKPPSHHLASPAPSAGGFPC